MRLHVVAGLAEAPDPEDLLLAADGLYSRLRDVIRSDPDFAVALARFLTQITWRLATDRYQQVSGDCVEVVVELTKDEVAAILKHLDEVLGDLIRTRRRYLEMLKTGRARSKEAVARRIAALDVLEQFLGSLEDSYEHPCRTG